MVFSGAGALASAAAMSGCASTRPRVHGESSEMEGRIVDAHLHPRAAAARTLAHLDGAGISHAVLLARDFDQAAQLRRDHPDRVVGFCISTDLTQPGSEDILLRGVRGGALGLGELKSHVALAGPEMRRVYAMAAELNVPVTIHMQDIPLPGEGSGWNTGFQDLEGLLKAFPRTRFIGHADTFWANIDASYNGQSLYQRGKITPGGITDRLLGDYENLYGDMSALSGNNALSRDPEFTPTFLERHRDKLIFGSDCPCADGRGSGNDRGPLAGKCVARETLSILRASAAPRVFRKLVWDNVHKFYGLRRA